MLSSDSFYLILLHSWVNIFPISWVARCRVLSLVRLESLHKPQSFDGRSGHKSGQTQNYNYDAFDYKGLKNHKTLENYYLATILQQVSHVL